MSTPRGARTRDQQEVIFTVGGEEFRLTRTMLRIHSPMWAQRLEGVPSVELAGSADSFRVFVEYLNGSSDVGRENFEHLLHWAGQFQAEHIARLCESFLLRADCKTDLELLEIAAKHNMPLLYRQASETVAQDLQYHQLDGLDGLPPTMASKEIREDLIRAHISMGVMRGECEMRRRHRFADHTSMSGPKQRARLLWKNRHLFQAPAPVEKPDWRSLQTVWPHHSLRGDDWTVVPAETQPTMPMRDRGAAAIRKLMS